MDEIHNSDNTLRSRVDGYGFDRSDDQHAEAIDKFMASYLSILARRASRWNNLLSSGERISKNRKLKRFCRKGIPNEHRKTMWMLLSGAEEKRKANPRTYRLLLDSQKDERVVETIALDLHRTFPENIFFSSEDGLQRPLRNVLVAASLYNPDKGYSQGLNFIAGLLLLIVKDEENVFWLMDSLMNNILPDFYSPGMEAVRAEQELLGEIIRWKDRELHDHIQEVGVQWCLVGTKWFMCLFADVLPTENKERLMACNNFQEMVAEIQEVIKNPKSLNCHKLMKHCFKKLGSFPTTRIEKMRQECLMRVGEQ
ncbi:growth hormone-regulated TBC protein 1-A-like isoform X4 [Crassostrea angulata]|nr:growth hormone-regulated TBC protein 1-A-like isoform X4 [Crassostrea angulata]